MLSGILALLKIEFAVMFFVVSNTWLPFGLGVYLGHYLKNKKKR